MTHAVYLGFRSKMAEAILRRSVEYCASTVRCSKELFVLALSPTSCKGTGHGESDFGVRIELAGKKRLNF
jgi:hypothetical protein